jgi:hypothetical protein
MLYQLSHWPKTYFHNFQRQASRDTSLGLKI